MKHYDIVVCGGGIAGVERTLYRPPRRSDRRKRACGNVARQLLSCKNFRTKEL